MASLALVLGQSMLDTVANHVARNSYLGCSAKRVEQSKNAKSIKEKNLFMI